MRHPALDGQWALILGASSGFGAACATALAEAGMHICGVHLDRRSTMANVERIVAEIKSHGREASFHNINAADAEKRAGVLDTLRERLDAADSPPNSPKTVRVLLHSLAFGTLGPYIGAREDRPITQRQMEMTLDVMANSVVYWTQDMVSRSLLGQGSKIYGMTSGGDMRVIPQYGAVSAAKAALAAHLRQLAVELAPQGIAANAIKAGITHTPALEKIPAGVQLLEFARDHNPSGRVTEPSDIAEAIIALSATESNWLTGNTINVDGAEDITVL